MGGWTDQQQRPPPSVCVFLISRRVWDVSGCQRSLRKIADAVFFFPGCHYSPMFWAWLLAKPTVSLFCNVEIQSLLFFFLNFNYRKIIIWDQRVYLSLHLHVLFLMAFNFVYWNIPSRIVWGYLVFLIQLYLVNTFSLSYLFLLVT